MNIARTIAMTVSGAAPMLVAGASALESAHPAVAAAMRAVMIAAKARDPDTAPAAVVPPAGAGGAAPAVPLPPDSVSPECLRRYAAMPEPEQRGDGARVRVCRDGYFLSYDPVTHDPDWVMEHLTPAKLTGTAQRTDRFLKDPALAGIDASDDDYKGKGLDRGHQAPAQDAKYDPRVMAESFYFSNMVPQVGIGFNRGAWKWLEERIRSWVCGGHDNLYVVTGPVYGKEDSYIGRNVRVPGSFFKIVYDADSGRGFGIMLPNKEIGGKIEDLQSKVFPIDEIEGETGLRFFGSFPLRQQEQLKSTKGAAWGRGETCRTVAPAPAAAPAPAPAHPAGATRT